MTAHFDLPDFHHPQSPPIACSAIRHPRRRTHTPRGAPAAVARTMLLRTALRALARRPRMAPVHTPRSARAQYPPLVPRAGTRREFSRPLCSEGGSDAGPDAERAKMHMMFTCGKCGTRALKSFSKKSYQTGIVIATCPGCEARHLIADNLGWFGEEKNIEEILAAKGIHVPVLNELGEYAPPDTLAGDDAGSEVDMSADDAPQPKSQ